MSDEQSDQRAAGPGRRAERGVAPAPGRRAEQSRKRRIDAVVALAIVLPAAVAIGLGLVRDDGLPPLPTSPPARAPLTSSVVVCPSAISEGEVSLTRVPQVAGGDVSVRTAPAPDGEPDLLADLPPGEDLPVVPGQLTPVPDSNGAVTVTGAGAAAPGIVAGSGERIAPGECRGPSFDEWFVGLGAASADRSTLELVNPEAGPAVVEISLFGPRGQLDAPDDLRSITVPGQSVQAVDLSAAMPKRVDFSAHLTVTRGRVTASVRQTYDPLGRGRVTTDFLLPQARPDTDNLLLGLEPDGARQLFVHNPGDDELRATVQVVTADAAFTPADTEDLVVGPEQTKRFALADLLPAGATKDSYGVLVRTTSPAAVAVRSLVEDDLALFSPLPSVEEPAVAVLPEGAKRLLLGGAERAGLVQVSATDADGEVVAEERVEVLAGGVAEVALPDDAVAITVQSRATPVSGTVLVSGAGSAPGLGVVRLRDAAVYADVPVVAPE